MDGRLAEIEMLYRTRFAAFVRTAAAITGDGESGRDAVQDAFAPAVRRRPDFDHAAIAATLGIQVGRADPPIRSLELRFADASVNRVPLVRRFFLYEEPADREATALVGRDAAGRVVAREPLPAPPLP